MTTLVLKLDLSPAGDRGKANALAGLTWTAGPSTTLSIASGRARATALSTTSPRIYKGPFTLIGGHPYKLTGFVYVGTGTNITARVAIDTTISTGGPYDSGALTVDTNLTGTTFTPSTTGQYYFGIVEAVTVAAQFGEVDDAFTVFG